MKNLDTIIENIDGVTYKELIELIRKEINTRYRSALYFGIRNGTFLPIQKKFIFPYIYYNYYTRSNLVKTEDIIKVAEEKIDKVIIFLHKRNKTEEYEKEIGGRRRDIYENEELKLKVPESAVLHNTKNLKIKLKLVEIRPYIKNPEKSMKKLEKILDKILLPTIYVPTILLIPIIYFTQNKKYFPSLLYMGKPYYQHIPFAFREKYETLIDETTVLQVPIKINKNLLSALLILKIIKYPTIEPYILGLSYEFEFEKSNLEYLNLELDFNEVRYKFEKSLNDIFKAIFNLKLKPSDLNSYQIVIGKNNPIFIDIAGGFEVPLTKNGLKYILAQSLIEILEGLYDSPLLKKCEKIGNKLVCNPYVKNPINIKEITDFPDELYYMLSRTYEITRKDIDKIKQHPIIKEYIDAVDTLKNDEFDLMRRYLLEVVKSYNKFPIDDYLDYKGYNKI